MSEQKNTTKSTLGFGSFPSPLASPEEMASEQYGLEYAKAIENQWDLTRNTGNFYATRIQEFEEARDYAAGKQDTSIYKQILTALDNNDNDGTLLNLDWRPVPIIPKYVNIIVNKTLDRNPRPNLEAIDPVSLTDKDAKKARIRAQVKNRELLMQAKQAGLKVEVDPEALPESTEESELLLENNVKTDSEIAAQMAARITLAWNNFDKKILRRLVEDFVVCGMAVPMRHNDPTYGIVEKYIDPSYFIHSYTEDPTFSDIHYAGHVEQITIGELKRLAGDKFSEDEYREIASKFSGRYGNKSERLSYKNYNAYAGNWSYGYDEYLVEVVFFQFKATECQYYQEKENKYGNKNVYYEGNKFKMPKSSVFERKPHKLEVEVTYSGVKIVGIDKLISYQKDQNMPRNMYDISRTTLRYFPVAVNLRNMMPTSVVAKIRGFADMLQITHLKWQGALAKAKNDGLAIDIEGLESVDLGRGEMNPLDLGDIYEKTNVFYYRSKTIDGQRTQNPVSPLPAGGQVFANLAATYNQYLRLIQDTTGVNDAMDGSSPKGEQLVGVREQAIQSGNNAIYDITVATKLMFTKVVDDIVKCIQVLPKDSLLYSIYKNAIGKTNMSVLNGFKNMPMVNIGVTTVMDMDDIQKAYLEQNIQVSLAAKELDIEDAIAIRNLQDLDQAEQLLILRRKKRMKRNQEMAMQNIQAQSQSNAQAAQVTAQAETQKEQELAAIELEKIRAKHEFELEKLREEYRLKKELAQIELGVKTKQKENEFQKQKELEEKREKAKDDRIKKQAAQQSHMIDQRQGKAERIQEPMDTFNIESII